MRKTHYCRELENEWHHCIWINLIEAFNSVLQDMELSCDVVVCPPFTAIERAVVLTKNTAIEVGAQTMDYHDAGAFTGEISPLMLTEVGVNYVIIGHSERRELLWRNR